MKNNEINSFGCRGCVINVIGLQNKYNEQYIEEQELFAKKMNETIESIDDKVLELAEQLTASRIRCNTVIVPENANHKKFAELIHHVIEDQYIAGQIINMEDNLKPYLGGFKEILSGVHTPPKPKIDKIMWPINALKDYEQQQKISEEKENETPVLRLGTAKNDK